MYDFEYDDIVSIIELIKLVLKLFGSGMKWQLIQIKVEIYETSLKLVYELGFIVNWSCTLNQLNLIEVITN
jgi:hypothetical protein